MIIATMIILLLATVTSGLTAGLFWAFGYAVMPALRRTDDRTFAEVMNQINVVILNGWFALCFGGAAIFGVLAVIVVAVGGSAALPWTITAVAVYAASLIITFAVNIPLNNALASTSQRAAFEGRWNRANVLRATGHTIAFVAFGTALLVY
ncbi:anthrone oxygenase family protein [Microlunatus soli]|uniref:DUF1772 domain-containing protein n=1 Tax=Microlunatus soli TaxID=630515 RepID=A0A1H1YAN3_9ACTN|nr:anthrone oxygenase family protein [Microlunatus soli]SDT18487.1 protein of unknown function [Microlunatus soli]